MFRKLVFRDYRLKVAKECDAKFEGIWKNGTDLLVSLTSRAESTFTGSLSLKRVFREVTYVFND